MKYYPLVKGLFQKPLILDPGFKQTMYNGKYPMFFFLGSGEAQKDGRILSEVFPSEVVGFRRLEVVRNLSNFGSEFFSPKGGENLLGFHTKVNTQLPLLNNPYLH